MELRDSQRVAVAKLCEPGRTHAALWAEPRSGKTAVALSWLSHIMPRVVVVVGPKSAEAVWKTECAKWLSCDYRFFPLTKGNDYPLDSSWCDGLNVMFVNYEQFTRLPYKRLGPFLRKLSKTLGKQGAMVLDESHIIKTPNSVTGRTIRRLANDWHYRLIITGTPVTNPSRVDEVYGQWTFMDPSIRDQWKTAGDFREHFGEWNTAKGWPELIRPRNQEELNKYLSKDVITLTRSSTRVTVRKFNYNEGNITRSLHEAMLKKSIVKVKGHTCVGLNPLVRLLRMRTLLAGWLKDDEDQVVRITDASTRRLAALGKVLNRVDGKVIVSCTHLEEIRQVKRWLTRQGIAYEMIIGATKDKDYVIQRFQRLKTIRVLLVQPRTVSMAVDLSVASDLVWYTADFNYMTFKQTSDRIKMSLAHPTVWFLCAKGTVDEDVWKTLMVDHNHLRKVLQTMGK